MLEYFSQKKNIVAVRKICELLNDVKKQLQKGSFSLECEEYDQSMPLFEEIKKMAVEIGDEQLANAQVVFKIYFQLFALMSSYFYMLKEQKYKASWDRLQDCLDCAIMVGKYTKMNKRFDVPEIIAVLSNYEKMYPYVIFASSEYVISKSHCSICGKSMQSLACIHRKGELYWGEIATEIIDEIKTVQAVSLVSHPENKRCVLELSNDNRNEMEKFQKLHEFLELNLPVLMNVQIQQRMEKRKKEIKVLPRNSKCSCGSGKKFKICCGKELYYDFEENIIQPIGIIQLHIFGLD